MGKFKFGTKGIKQMAALEESADDILALSPMFEMIPEIHTVTEYVDRDVIKEIPVDRVIEKVVEVERIVEVEKIVEKIIANPELQNKVVLMSKEIEDLKQKLALSNENLASSYNRMEKDLQERMDSVKQYTKDLKQDNSLEHNKFKKQISTMQYCMVGLLILSIIGMVL